MLKIDDINNLVQNRANEQVEQTLALFFNKLYQQLVLDNNIQENSGADLILKQYFEYLNIYVNNKLQLHKLRKRENYDFNYVVPSNENDDRIINLYKNISLYKLRKDEYKNKLLDLGIEIPKNNYPNGIHNSRFPKWNGVYQFK